ncbi:MAG: hypothetical protein AAF823_03790 [Planctomycetota bacterium]
MPKFGLIPLTRRLVECLAQPSAPRPDHRPEFEPLEPRVLFSTTYWVDASVASSGNGLSQGAAFKTIGEATAAADQAGDIVNIKPGTYRETVTFAHSGNANDPITFRQAPGTSGDVVVSGLDEINSGWSVYSDPSRNIFQRTINPTWDWDSGQNQIFIDGKAMTWARWPNITDVTDVNQPNWAFADNLTYADSGSTRNITITEGSIPGSSFSAWGEGFVHISPGDGWVHQTGEITSATNDGAGKRISFDVEKFSSGNVYRPETGDRFYLVGAFRALDAPGEWFIQDNGGGSHTLYLRGDNNQNLGSGSIDVEFKARDTAINFAGRSHIVLQGIDVLGARVITGNDSRNLVIDSMEAKYIEHYDLIDDSGITNPFSFKTSSGIRLSGENHVLRDSTIQFSAVNGITVEGKGHKVLHNSISEVNYVGVNGAGIRIGYGSGGGIDQSTLTRHEIGFNKVFNTGRSGITGAIQGGSIHHNEIHNVLMQSRDGGGIYINNVRGNGSVIAYNKIHDVFNYDNVTGGGSSPSDKENTTAGLSSDAVGIYLDNTPTTASDFVVHHNTVWNVGEALRLNASAFTNVNNKVYNNTLVGVGKAVASWVGTDGSFSTSLAGTDFINNILVGEIFGTDAYDQVDFFNNVYTDATTINSLQSGQGNVKVSRSSLNFLNDTSNANADFRLGSGSTARDAGQFINAYTQGANGTPDAGSLEGVPSGGGFDVGPGGDYFDDNRGTTVSAASPTAIKANWYDTLGGAVSYFDTNSANPSGWRDPSAVDASSFAVNNVSNGEYLDYTLDVAGDNEYDMVIRASKGGSGTTIITVHTSSDGVNFNPAGSVNITGNGNWGDYRDLAVNGLGLGSGFQVVRLSFSGATNVDKFTLTPVVLNTNARVQAEDFSGLATSGSNDWRAVTSGSPDYAWVPSVSTSNQRFWNASAGPTMSYTLSGMQAGTYNLTVRTNSDAQGSAYRGNNNSFWIRVNGSSWKLVSVNTSAGWSTKTFTSFFDLTSGDNNIEIAAREDGTKID